jgi:hypothetical protein
MANSFERAAQHPLRISEASGASAGFVSGWNDALTISLSVGAPPPMPAEWYPAQYQDGWKSCRALLLTISNGSNNAPVVSSVTAV